jgi:hypothetical protein
MENRTHDIIKMGSNGFNKDKLAKFKVQGFKIKFC